MLRVNSDFERSFHEVNDLLTRPGSCFLSRIGGSDTNAVIDYLRVTQSEPHKIDAHIDRWMPIVSQYNGFYALSDTRNQYQNYLQYLVKMYQSSTNFTFCNYQLLSLYFKDILHPNYYVEDFENKLEFEDFVKSLVSGCDEFNCYSYNFIEKCVFDRWTLFWSLSNSLGGKRVLVVSPFALSINKNFENRHSFFKKDYNYPEFALQTVNVPVTYSGLPPEFYPHDNWFETLSALQAEIAKLDFDIALLSCGSYTMGLGVYIDKELGRKAVYVGGVLQLYFGIMGRRYQDTFFTDQINSEYFIKSLEAETYLKHVNIAENLAREAFGAYF